MEGCALVAIAKGTVAERSEVVDCSGRGVSEQPHHDAASRLTTDRDVKEALLGDSCISGLQKKHKIQTIQIAYFYSSPVSTIQQLVIKGCFI